MVPAAKCKYSSDVIICNWGLSLSFKWPHFNRDSKCVLIRNCFPLHTYACLPAYSKQSINMKKKKERRIWKRRKKKNFPQQHWKTSSPQDTMQPGWAPAPFCCTGVPTNSLPPLAHHLQDTSLAHHSWLQKESDHPPPQPRYPSGVPVLPLCPVEAPRARGEGPWAGLQGARTPSRSTQTDNAGGWPP